jgi:hypothetical protein
MIWQKSKLRKKPWEYSQDYHVFKPSGLNEGSKIAIIFLMLLFGLVLSGMEFIGEIITAWICRKIKLHL